MQVTVLCTLLLGVSATACHADNPASPDGAIAGSDATSTSGLTVVWSTQPTAIPGTLDGGISISSMLFRVQDLRVIGDAGPGDPRTTQNTFQLSWAANHAPANIVFAGAPSGLYSKVSIVADGNLIDYSYEIYGTVNLQGNNSRPFKVHDRSPIAVELDTSTMLDPGKGAGVAIEIEVGQALSMIDYTMLDTDGGALELDTFDSQMAGFRSKLVSSFVVTHGE